MSPCYFDGIATGDVVDGAGTVYTVYAVTADNATVALSGKDGSVIWRVVAATDVCYPGCLTLTSHGSVTFCDGGGSIHAVSAATGSPLWSTPLAIGAFAVVDVVTTPRGTLAVLATAHSDPYTHAGELLELDAVTGAGVWRLPAGALTDAAYPSLLPDVVVYSTGNDGVGPSPNASLVAWSVSRGAALWVYTVSGYDVGALQFVSVVDGLGLVLAVQNGGFYPGCVVAVALATGREAWRYCTASFPISVPVAVAAQTGVVVVYGGYVHMNEGQVS